MDPANIAILAALIAAFVAIFAASKKKDDDA